MKLVAFWRMSFDIIEKIVDHPGLSTMPEPPEKVYLNPATEFVNRYAVLAHCLRVILRKLVSGIVQKVDLFIWIGQIAKTDEVRLDDFERFIIRGYDDGDRWIFVQLWQLF